MMITIWQQRFLYVTLTISVNMCHLDGYDRYNNCSLDCERVQRAVECISS